MSASNEKFIAVMGATGTGKSTFIRSVTKDAQVVVGHGLESQTSSVKESCFTTEDGQKIVFIDTPGFEDSREEVRDVDILQMIVDYLQKRGIEQKISGILYLHRVSDPRVTKASRKNLDMFKALCGDAVLSNVVLATTFWDSVPPEVGERREKELLGTRNLFQQLVKHGAKLMRLVRGPEPAKSILDYLMPKQVVTPQIITELREGKALANTSAGSIIAEEINKFLAKLRVDMVTLRKDIEEAISQRNEKLRRDLKEDRRELQEMLDRLLKDRKKLSSYGGAAAGVEFEQSLNLGDLFH